MNEQAIREIAILIDSLDQATADQLLAEFTSTQRQAILNAAGRVDATKDERKSAIDDAVDFLTTVKSDEPCSVVSHREARHSDISDEHAHDQTPCCGAGRQSLKTCAVEAGELAPASEDEVAAEVCQLAPGELQDSNQYPFVGKVSSNSPIEVAADWNQNWPSDQHDRWASFSMDQICGLLQGERMQTVAVVVASLPPDRAANLLACWEAERQSQILQSLVEMGPPRDEVVEVIHTTLAAKVAADQESWQQARPAARQVHSILQFTNPRNREHLLQQLADQHADLAEMVQAEVAAKTAIVEAPEEATTERLKLTA